MEFLFTGQIASIEAFIVFACIFIVFSIFAYDAYLSVRDYLSPFLPKRGLPLSDVGETSLQIPTVDISEKVHEEIVIENIPKIPHFQETSTEENHSESTDNITPMLPGESRMITEGLKEKDVDIQNEVSSIESSSLVEEIAPQNDILTNTGEKINEVLPVNTDSIGGVLIPEEEQKNDALDMIPSLPVSRESVHETLSVEHIVETVSEPIKHHRRTKKEKLLDIVNNVKTLIARGHIEDARGLLVSGLAIEKNHRELNIVMASLYERDHAFAKAEYILKDIAMTYPDDIEILTHLATDLAMQRKYEVSYEIYKKILSLGGGNEEALYTLAHLASEMDLPLDVANYARTYLKQYPHNPDVLWLYSQAQITNGERRDAIDTLIKLKNLTPYNQEIADLIQKLVTEEELAGNFGHTNS